jgi:hypothetical protein
MNPKYSSLKVPLFDLRQHYKIYKWARFLNTLFKRKHPDILVANVLPRSLFLDVLQLSQGFSLINAIWKSSQCLGEIGGLESTVL